ncbi:hypothetical protein SUGI_1300960 [Cryptomeria japonica]|uniref:Uncharacterized protein n=1 Tax=Cryptomeria japonica TaxID=3369 RepID=A0AAD3RPD9_CRYJA|nr:hypothetical protein SUGI_1300880 [Cryptomeria japonica]GLJ57128.1 hypothetical protein SUGI_1300910 [Cryptomeria japonica]GLJ57131.1 hypothetical protein SUGI_1300960 [Cryptomeria japonica]
MATVSDLVLILVAGLAIYLQMQEAAAVKFEITNQCGYTVWAAGLPGGGQQLDQGTCQTGDCNGQLSCQVSGGVPTTLAEYTHNGDGNKDFYDVSLVDGFNGPLSINPTNEQCTAPACKADVNAVCPAELKVNGGCNSACTVFQTDQYCCRGAYVDNCPATNYSMIFKNQCPQAYSYAKDDTSSTFTCPSGTTDYSIVFCP